MEGGHPGEQDDPVPEGGEHTVQLQRCELTLARGMMCSVSVEGDVAQVSLAVHKLRHI